MQLSHMTCPILFRFNFYVFLNGLLIGKEAVNNKHTRRTIKQNRGHSAFMQIQSNFSTLKEFAKEYKLEDCPAALERINEYQPVTLKDNKGNTSKCTADIVSRFCKRMCTQFLALCYTVLLILHISGCSGLVLRSPTCKMLESDTSYGLNRGETCLCDDSGRILRLRSSDGRCITCDDHEKFNSTTGECDSCSQEENCGPSVRTTCKRCLDEDLRKRKESLVTSTTMRLVTTKSSDVTASIPQSKALEKWDTSETTTQEDWITTQSNKQEDTHTRSLAESFLPSSTISSPPESSISISVIIGVLVSVVVLAIIVVLVIFKRRQTGHNSSHQVDKKKKLLEKVEPESSEDDQNKSTDELILNLI